MKYKAHSVEKESARDIKHHENVQKMRPLNIDSAEKENKA